MKYGSWMLTVIIVTIITILVINGYLEKDKICEYEESTVKEIYSLNIGKDISGSFFIGIGNFQNTIYYYFYEKDGDGMRLNRLNAEYTKLVETDDRTPAYVTYRCGCILTTCGEGGRTTLFIPKGAVKTKFDIDLKEVR